MDAGKVACVRHVHTMQVVQAVRSANMDFPTGKIKDNDAQFVVRIAGKFKSIEDLRDLVVGSFPPGRGHPPA